MVYHRHHRHNNNNMVVAAESPSAKSMATTVPTTTTKDTTKSISFSARKQQQQLHIRHDNDDMSCAINDEMQQLQHLRKRLFRVTVLCVGAACTTGMAVQHYARDIFTSHHYVLSRHSNHAAFLAVAAFMAVTVTVSVLVEVLYQCLKRVVRWIVDTVVLNKDNHRILLQLLRQCGSLNTSRPSTTSGSSSSSVVDANPPPVASQVETESGGGGVLPDYHTSIPETTAAITATVVMDGGGGGGGGEDEEEVQVAEIPPVPPPKYLPPEPPMDEEDGEIVVVESKDNSREERQTTMALNTNKQENGNIIEAKGGDGDDGMPGTASRRKSFVREKKNRKPRKTKTKKENRQQRQHIDKAKPFRVVKDNLFRRPDIYVPDVDPPKDERKRSRLDFRKLMFWRRKVHPEVPKDESPPWTEPYQKKKNYQEDYGL
eukprot:scaffold41001_cov214-Amphora_coffeaeformis.AAC.3